MKLNPPSISREEFRSLRHGDVVRVRGLNQCYFRTILLGPGDGEFESITMPIRRRSWTGRVTTVKFYPDVCYNLEYTGLRSRMIVSKDEIFSWLQSGLKPSAGMLRDLRDDLQFWKRQPQRFHCIDPKWVSSIKQFIKDLKFADL